jgi:hypothetical protein
MASLTFVDMSSNEVKKIAEDCIAAIERFEKRRRAEIITQHRTEMENSWWRKLCKKPSPTDNEVVDHLKGDCWSGMCMEYFWIGRCYSDVKVIARNVLVGCNKASAIHITVSDLERITRDRKTL